MEGTSGTVLCHFQVFIRPAPSGQSFHTSLPSAVFQANSCQLCLLLLSTLHRIIFIMVCLLFITCFTEYIDIVWPMPG
ncbi:hypothetical protein M8J76_006785 [Diaphorina citri]|nr:hypothetical protein M8J75_007619 [Diaphorina citri]KAI5744940.1 hypothetical protein M8J76_006785 [Diaphorina citri]